MRIRTWLIMGALLGVLDAPRAAQSAAALAEDRRSSDASSWRWTSSYSAASRAAAERRLAALEAALPATTPAQFELEIARIVALADNGHTNAAALGRARRHNRVPLRLAPFIGDFFVLRARGANANLLGARLIAIDEQPSAKLREIAHGFDRRNRRFP